VQASGLSALRAISGTNQWDNTVASLATRYDLRVRGFCFFELNRLFLAITRFPRLPV
jgi:hypothetical protein